MATDSEKRKVTIEAAESRTAFIPVESCTSIIDCQYCLLCENTRTLPKGMHYCNTPWVCDECKKAIAFIKEFKASIKQPDLTVPSQGLPKVELIPL